MIDKKYIAAILILIGMAAFFFSCWDSSSRHYDMRVVKLKQGWGYEIRKNNKTFIYQTVIPAVGGNKVFADRQSAKRTGKLVLSKLKNQQTPGITDEELRQLGIIE